MRNRIIYLPFENLPQRYTAMWNWAVERQLDAKDIVVLVPNPAKQIKAGEFLDTFDTIAYKARQMQAVADLFARGQVHDGDVFYAPDIFYSGLEAIRYMSELSGISVKIAAFNHAGRADETDFVQRLGSWADMQEQAWHDLCDLVMVGSQYHRARVVDTFSPKRVEVVGAVWSSEWMKQHSEPTAEKEEMVIWPHRICEEKRFDFFLDVARANPDLHFVITTGGPAKISPASLPKNVEYRYSLTKSQYYDIFSRSKYFLSTAYQETFGYTVQEAIYFGCRIICPDYACYPEYVARESLMSFDEMLRPGLLTKKYREDNLCRSHQFHDNAAEITYKLRQL